MSRSMPAHLRSLWLCMDAAVLLSTTSCWCLAWGQQIKMDCCAPLIHCWMVLVPGPMLFPPSDCHWECFMWNMFEILNWMKPGSGAWQYSHIGSSTWLVFERPHGWFSSIYAYPLCLLIQPLYVLLSLLVLLPQYKRMKNPLKPVTRQSSCLLLLRHISLWHKLAKRHLSGSLSSNYFQWCLFLLWLWITFVPVFLKPWALLPLGGMCKAKTWCKVCSFYSITRL